MLVALTNRQIESLFPQIVDIYRDAFVPPPYSKSGEEIAEFADSLPIHMERQGFRFIGAYPRGREQIVGFAYGYASQSGQGWYKIVNQALPPQTASKWLRNSFQFSQIAVKTKFQGQGIGGRLHDQLLDGLPYERAVLTTMQAETVAFQMYRARGWEVLYENLFVPEVGRRYQVMGLALKRPDGQVRRTSKSASHLEGSVAPSPKRYEDR